MKKELIEKIQSENLRLLSKVNSVNSRRRDDQDSLHSDTFSDKTVSPKRQSRRKTALSLDDHQEDIIRYLRDKVKQLNAEISELREEKEKNPSELLLRDAQKKIKELEKKNIDEAKEMNDKFKYYIQTHKNLKKEIQELRNTSSSPVESHESINKIQTLTEEKQMVLDELELLRKRHDKLFAELQEKEKSSLETEDRLKRALADMKVQQENLRSENVSLKDNIMQLRSEKAPKRYTLDVFCQTSTFEEGFSQKKFERLQQKSEHLQEKNLQLKKEIQEIQTASSKYEIDAKQVERKMKRLETKIQSQKLEIEKLQSLNKDLRLANVQLEEEMTFGSTKVIDSLSTEKKRHNIEIETLTNQFNLERKELNSENLALKQEISNLKHESSPLMHTKYSQTSVNKTVHTRTTIVQTIQSVEPIELSNEISDTMQQLSSCCNRAIKEIHTLKKDLRNERESNPQDDEFKSDNLETILMKDFEQHMRQISLSLQEKEKEIVYLHSNIQELQGNMDKKDSIIDTFSKDNPFTQTIASLEEEMNELKVQTHEIQRISDQRQVEIDHLQSVNERLKVQHKEELARLMEKVKNSEDHPSEKTDYSKINNLQRENRELKSKLSATMNTSDEYTIRSLQEENKQLKEEIDDLMSKCHALEKKSKMNRSLDQDFDNLKSEQEEIIDERDRLKELIRQMSDEIDQEKSRVNHLELLLQDRDQRIDSLESQREVDLELRDQELLTLANQKEVGSEQVHTLKRELKQAKLKKVEQEEMIHSLEAQNAQLKQQVVVLNSNSHAVTSSDGKKTLLIEELTKENERLIQEQRRLQDEIKRLDAQVSLQILQKQTNTSEIEMLSQQRELLSQKTREIEMMTQKLKDQETVIENKTAELKDTSKQLRNVQEDNENLRNRINKTKKQLQSDRQPSESDDLRVRLELKESEAQQEIQKLKKEQQIEIQYLKKVVEKEKEKMRNQLSRLKRKLQEEQQKSMKLKESLTLTDSIKISLQTQAEKDKQQISELNETVHHCKQQLSELTVSFMAKEEDIRDQLYSEMDKLRAHYQDEINQLKAHHGNKKVSSSQMQEFEKVRLTNKHNEEMLKLSLLTDELSVSNSVNGMRMTITKMKQDYAKKVALLQSHIEELEAKLTFERHRQSESSGIKTNKSQSQEQIETSQEPKLSVIASPSVSKQEIFSSMTGLKALKVSHQQEIHQLRESLTSEYQKKIASLNTELASVKDLLARSRLQLQQIPGKEDLEKLQRELRLERQTSRTSKSQDMYEISRLKKQIVDLKNKHKEELEKLEKTNAEVLGQLTQSRSTDTIVELLKSKIRDEKEKSRNLDDELEFVKNQLRNEERTRRAEINRSHEEQSILADRITTLNKQLAHTQKRLEIAEKKIHNKFSTSTKPVIDRATSPTHPFKRFDRQFGTSITTPKSNSLKVSSFKYSVSVDGTSIQDKRLKDSPILSKDSPTISKDLNSSSRVRDDSILGDDSDNENTDDLLNDSRLDDLIDSPLDAKNLDDVKPKKQLSTVGNDSILGPNENGSDANVMTTVKQSKDIPLDFRDTEKSDTLRKAMQHIAESGKKNQGGIFSNSLNQGYLESINSAQGHAMNDGLSKGYAMNDGLSQSHNMNQPLPQSHNMNQNASDGNIKRAQQAWKVAKSNGLLNALRVESSEPLRLKLSSAEIINDLDFSPDGKEVLMAQGSKVAIFDVDQQIIVNNLDPQCNIVNCVAYSPLQRPDDVTSGFFATAGSIPKHVVVIWSKNGVAKLRYPNRSMVNCLLYNPSNGTLLSGTEHNFGVYAMGWKSVVKYPVSSKVLCFSWNYSGTLLALGHQNGLVDIRDGTKTDMTGEGSSYPSVAQHFSNNNGPITCISWHPKVNYIAIGSLDMTISILRYDPSRKPLIPLAQRRLNWKPYALAYVGGSSRMLSNIFIVAAGNHNKCQLFSEYGDLIMNICNSKQLIKTVAKHPWNPSLLAVADSSRVVIRNIQQLYEGGLRHQLFKTSALTDVQIECLRM